MTWKIELYFDIEIITVTIVVENCSIRTRNMLNARLRSTARSSGGALEHAVLDAPNGLISVRALLRKSVAAKSNGHHGLVHQDCKMPKPAATFSASARSSIAENWGEVALVRNASAMCAVVVGRVNQLDTIIDS